MTINRELVLHIAKLAHLKLEEFEIEMFAGQLQQILEYIDKLKQVNADCEPFSFAGVLPMQTRPDETAPSLPVEKVVHNAPQRLGRLFKVPRILP